MLDQSGGDVSIIREPDDKLADARASIGSKDRLGAYLVFRGDPERVLQTLRAVLADAEVRLPRGDYSDRRKRPQG